MTHIRAKRLAIAIALVAAAAQPAGAQGQYPITQAFLEVSCEAFLDASRANIAGTADEAQLQVLDVTFTYMIGVGDGSGIDLKSVAQNLTGACETNRAASFRDVANKLLAGDAE